MKTNKRILPALLMSLFAGAGATTAGAQQFNGFVVFGDSLSDAGYYRPFLAQIGVPATLVPVLGRFTTSPGPIWAEVLSSDLGLGPVAPSNVSGGLDYAQGGARVATSSASTPPGAAQRPVSTQVGEYLAHTGGAADSRTLYAVWGGANDVIQTIQGAGAGLIPPDQVSGIIQGAAGAEIQQIGRLSAAGARYIVVFGLPNIGGTPAFTAAGAAASAGATQASAGFNTALFTGLASAGLRVIPVDSYTFFSEIAASPSTYGFTNVTVPACKPFPPFSSAPDALFCPPGNTLTPNAAQTFLFADGVHPTTAGHQLIAEFVESMIEGPTAYSLLAETPIAMRDGQRRGIYEGLGSGSRADIGKMSVFATYDRGKFDVDSSVGMSGLSSDGNTATLGFTARVSETVILGLAYGHGTSDASFGGDMGSYRAKENVVSAFGRFDYGGFYGTAIVSVGNVDYSGLHRNITLGTSMRTATASPSGSNASAFVEGGYDFKVAGLWLGPLVSVNSQNVTVNAFDESGAASANLHIEEQSRRSEVWSVGVHASFPIGEWTPWLRVTADKERKDDLRMVSARPLSLASNNTYDIPAYQFDNSFVTSAIGIRGTLMKQIGVSLAYYTVSGRSGMKDDGVTGMLSYQF